MHLQSCLVHGVCGFIYFILEQNDLRCYTAYLEEQKHTEGGKDSQSQLCALEEQGSSIPAFVGSSSKSAPQLQSTTAVPGAPHRAAPATPFARNSEPTRHSSDAGSFSAEAAAVLAPSAHPTVPHRHHNIHTSFADILHSFSAPTPPRRASLQVSSNTHGTLTTRPVSLDEHDEHQYESCADPEFAALQQNLRSITARTQDRVNGLKYKRLQRRHLVGLLVAEC